MAKCIRCGKNTLVRGHVGLKDGAICTPCFKELGYKITDATTSRLYTYSELVERKHPTPSVKISNYGQNRDHDCTDAEAEIFHIIRSRLDDMNYNTDCLKLVRKSDSYVSAVMDSGSDYGQMDLARFKFTDRTKWIKICPDFDKIELNDVEDVAKLSDALFAGYSFNEPYL